jgi:alpha-L-rhamnosidase
MENINGKNHETTEKRRKWQAKWIGHRHPDIFLTDWRRDVLPAPFFRKVFSYDSEGGNSKVYICGLGYYELYLNGRKVGEQVLDPVVTVYDHRVRYVVHDVTEFLMPGKNVIGIILGNGWYNSHTAETWHFNKASWRDYPKLLLQLEIGSELKVCSDDTWKVSSGPIIFDGLRNGEIYDARLELDGWLTPDYDDSGWRPVVNVAPPGGVLQLQTMPSCKVMQTLRPVDEWMFDNGDRVYDLGQNMTGWARITVSGRKGAEVIIKYGERLDDKRQLDQSHISKFIRKSDFQTDRYILKGDGVETWEPRFTYHGFQYVSISGDAEIRQVEGRVVYTSFDRIGNFSCSDKTLNKLHECTIWSYIGNFTGIPTDCPHREKNGWTGDAQLAAETGLFNFDAGSSYTQWMDSIADCQRPSGQLPGIAPSSGWGYNWGNGPAYDSAFLLIPWYVYLYTGNKFAIETHYDSMKKYVDYCTSMATGHIVSFGLGDWCHVDKERIVDRALTDTGYYYTDALLLTKFALMTRRKDDHEQYSSLAESIKTAFNRKFYRGDGIYANGEQTALACAIYQELVEDSEKAKVVAKLAESVKANGNKPDFGILGAKYVPRVLADNGHVDLSYKLITQPEFPGWACWLEQGATTLWESWNGKSSRNHIMFGDISAWMYQYLAGITPDPENPGFKHVIIKPHPVSGLKWVSAEHRSPYGIISSKWKISRENFSLEVLIPSAATATVIMPDSCQHEVTSGKYEFTASINWEL